MNPDQELTEYAEKLEQSNRELIEAREAALNAVKVKSEFLSNMSHELRTPLNAIIGISDVLTDTNLSDEQKKYISVLKRNGESLLHLIDDILNFSRLESGQLPLQCAGFQLEDLIHKVIEMVKPLAAAKQLELRFQIAPEIPKQVSGDAKKLEQILINLLGNAIKFTGTGTVKLKIEERNHLQGELLFSICDTGIGIPEDKMKELFRRFSQADPSITKSFGGSGLGLAISKQLVELMGGMIWVESKEQQGATFSFTVRLPEVTTLTSEKVKISPANSSILNGKKVLVVEDSSDNALLMSLYMRGTGCSVDFAVNGKEAVEKFEAKPYDLILMDMQMPEMDGYSATRWIRLLEKRKPKKTPIIALTAFAMQEEVEKSLASGCDLHLNKPVTKSALFSAITSQIEPQTTQLS
jgi:CheY-like chemotaxis protein/nitrogen-specific signal transduction histidine kinase